MLASIAEASLPTFDFVVFELPGTTTIAITSTKRRIDFLWERRAMDSKNSMFKFNIRFG